VNEVKPLGLRYCVIVCVYSKDQQAHQASPRTTVGPVPFSARHKLAFIAVGLSLKAHESFQPHTSKRSGDVPGGASNVLKLS